MTNDEAIACLDRALGEEIGFVVKVTVNSTYAYQTLQEARKGIAKYDCLIIAQPQIENTVFIYKRTVSLNPEVEI
jgi:Trk K+ transport system NAD-binding subunit